MYHYSPRYYGTLLIVDLRKPFICLVFSCTAEEYPAEVKPDQSPIVKKEEPSLAEPKLQDGATATNLLPPTTASTGSGRRKSKKQKTEAAITGILFYI